MMNDNKLLKASVSVSRPQVFPWFGTIADFPFCSALRWHVSLSVSGGILFPNPLVHVRLIRSSEHIWEG